MSKTEASVNAMNLRMAVRGRDQSFIQPSEKHSTGQPVSMDGPPADGIARRQVQHEHI